MYANPIEDPILTTLSIGRFCPTSLDLSPFSCVDKIMLEDVLSDVPIKPLICSGPTVVLGKKRKADSITTNEGTNGLGMGMVIVAVKKGLHVVIVISDSEYYQSSEDEDMSTTENEDDNERRIVVFGLPALNEEFGHLLFPRARHPMPQSEH